MPDMIGISGGPEEDRTPDLFIANGEAIIDINDLLHSNRAKNSRKSQCDCTFWAQSGELL